MNNFYVTLLSDSSLSTFPNNKQCEFTVKLDRPIHIDKDQWEVGLVELITPTEVNNITLDNNLFQVRIYNDQICDDLNVCQEPLGHQQHLQVQPGFYKSPQHLVEEIQYQIDTWFGESLKKRNATIKVDYVESRNRVKLGFQDPKKVKIVFPTRLGEILGLDSFYFDTPVDDQMHIFKYGVDLNTKIHQMYVYSDIASYTFLGDVTAPILRVTPFLNKQGDNQLHQEFVNVHYVPVAKSFIDQVHISIKGDTGEDVSFISGKTLVKLHFRQKQ